jgi:hypothetical protein
MGISLKAEINPEGGAPVLYVANVVADSQAETDGVMAGLIVTAVNDDSSVVQEHSSPEMFGDYVGGLARPVTLSFHIPQDAAAGNAGEELTAGGSGDGGGATDAMVTHELEAEAALQGGRRALRGGRAR